jgi:hypothetical protein
VIAHVKGDQTGVGQQTSVYPRRVFSKIHVLARL